VSSDACFLGSFVSTRPVERAARVTIWKRCDGQAFYLEACVCLPTVTAGGGGNGPGLLWIRILASFFQTALALPPTSSAGTRGRVAGSECKDLDGGWKAGVTQKVEEKNLPEHGRSAPLQQ
jgi:hypothetical protein